MNFTHASKWLPSGLYYIVIELYTLQCSGHYTVECDVQQYFTLDCKLHCILTVSLTQQSHQRDLPIISEEEKITCIPPLQCTAHFTVH